MMVLVTGGLTGLGKELVSYFGGDQLSRSNGFDIKDESALKEIANKSLEYECFINNAFDGPPHKEWANWGQAKLLQEVFNTWAKKKKSGYIINIGSIGSVTNVEKFQDFELYRVSKYALDSFSSQATKAFVDKKVQFKTSLIRLDRIDTEKSRSRSSWTGVGHQAKEVIEIIELYLNSPDDSCIECTNIKLRL